MRSVAVVAYAALALAGVLNTGRLLRPGSLPDRVIALDALLLVVVSGIAVNAFATRSGLYLDLMVVATLLGFVGMVMVARFIERNRR